MEQNTLVVLLSVAGCYATPRHQSNRQALSDAGWKPYLAKVNVYVRTVPKTISKSVDGEHDSKTTTTTTFTTIVKKFLIVDEEVHWGAAKSSCESIGAKLAEPKTEKQAKFLGEHMGDEVYWIGGSCVSCSTAGEDKWAWVSGGKVSLDNKMWGLYEQKQTPWDTEGTTHDAFSMSLARDSDSENKLTFSNFKGSGHNYKYICELA